MDEKDLQLIQFHAGHPYRDSLPPVRALNNIPQWWKDSTLFHEGSELKHLKVQIQNGRDIAFLSYKHCMPFFDALTGGYHYVLPVDIEVSIAENGKPNITWDGDVIRPVDVRGNQEIPLPPYYHDVQFIWEMRWGLKTPQGYSCIVTHPLNRYDLPFITISGIWDSDSWTSPNAIAFHLRKDFEGTIPKGTPLFTIFPYKRENWQSKVNHDLYEESRWDLERKRRFIYGFYKKFRWKKKSYK